MNTTLDALEARRRARHSLGRDLRCICYPKPNESLQRSLDVIRTNPLPVALIGLGVAWLISNNTGVTDRVTETGRRVTDTATDMGRRVADTSSPRRRYGDRHQPPRRRTRHRRRPEGRYCRLRRPRARAHRPSDCGPGRRARRRLGTSDERPCLGRASFGARFERRPSAQGRELCRSRRGVRCVRAPSADHRRDRCHDRCADRGAAADLGSRERAARRRLATSCGRRPRISAKRRSSACARRRPKRPCAPSMRPPARPSNRSGSSARWARNPRRADARAPALARLELSSGLIYRDPVLLVRPC